MEPERAPDIPEPDLPGKVVKLHQALDRADIPHAFGGAIAVGYYREPRATIDIDVCIFVQPADRKKVLDSLATLFPLPDRDALGEDISGREQGQAKWGRTKIDLFFSFLDFHESVAARTRIEDYEGTAIPILSAEDIIIFKVIYGRAQDWADIEAVFELRGEELDLEYMTDWIRKLVGDKDSIGRLKQLATAESDGETPQSE